MPSDHRTPLEVTPMALCVGQLSVGFPMTRTSEQVMEAYLELVGMLRDERPEDLRSEDIDTLVAVTRLERSFVLNRLESQLAHA